MRIPEMVFALLLATASPLRSQTASVDTAPVAVVQRFVDAANGRNLARMMATVARDAVFAPLPENAPLAVGRDSIQAFYQRVLSDLPPSLRVVVESRLSDGAFVVDREYFVDRGAQRRDHATWIYQVSGGLIRRAWVLRPAKP